MYYSPHIHLYFQRVLLHWFYILLKHNLYNFHVMRNSLLGNILNKKFGMKHSKTMISIPGETKVFKRCFFNKNKRLKLAWILWA